MKALILSCLLIIGLTATNHGKPINDIYSVKEPIFTEEAYVSDIPFNTWEIAVDAILEGDKVELAEEPYVNDIPFDTRTIACKYLLRKMLETSEESNVNDIPFSTDKVMCEYMAALMTEQYRNEKNITDLPEGPNYIICTYENGVSTCVAVKIKMPRHASARQRKIESSDFTIIYPVKPVMHKLELNNDARDPEIQVIPNSSL